MRGLNIFCLLLTIIGAINWGFIALFDFNMVTAIFGTGSAITTIIYALVGLAGIINIGLLIEMINETDRK
jgi:uncharacterized membrane protein YuzA (DUF378 family)